jgi:pimeloyl-ACP methyl ester carboxylesterase
MMQLVLVPGLASNAVMWRHQLAALPQRLQPVVTDVHTRHDTIAAMARALLDEHPGDLLLCGASMGGIVAMEVARQAPQRVKALALLGTNARPETDDMRRLRHAAIELFESGRAAEVLRANLPLAFHASRATDAQLTQTYLDFVLQAGATQLIRQNRAIITRPDARAHLAKLSCPVLVMCGDSDQLTPPECSQEIAALVPNGRLVIVPLCGHMLTMEQPELVNATLLDWLAQVAPGD